MQESAPVRVFDGDPNVYLHVGEEWYFYDPTRPPLGAGAMGKVFLGYNYKNGDKVAIKQLYDQYASSPDIRRRGEQEASLSYAHPHLVEMLGCCIYCDEGNNYYMWVLSRYVKGVNIDQYLKSLPVSDPVSRLTTIIGLISNVLDALAYLHSKGVIHRDIKPSNIMVDDNGSVHLMDLGIARVSASNAYTSMGFVGTPLYAPPEQILRDKLQKQATQASDIYSLGVTLYTLINETNPFDAQSEAEILSNQVTMKLPVTDKIPPKLAKRIMPVIWKATEKSQETRYQSAIEFKQALNDSLTISNPTPKWLPAVIGCLIAMLIMIVIFIITL